jgi:CheY-like chemotaxis protein/phosphoribosyl 1,2-cyclic phosphodiesterase
MRLKFWGVRGSIPVPSPAVMRYGGNTSCVEVRTDAGTLLILDCGTGARLLGKSLLQEAQGQPLQGHILFGHTHWDHIQGLPFFPPVFVPGNVFHVYGPSGIGRNIGEALAGQMQYDYFPVALEQCLAQVHSHDLTEGHFTIGDVDVRTQYLNHPLLTLGYRLSVGSAQVVYATDHEPFAFESASDGAAHRDALPHGGDRSHIAFVEDADILIHDAQYAAEEYSARRGWGHSTVEYCTDVALAAGVRHLVLFHHDPDHDDDRIDALVERCRQRVAERGGSLRVTAAAEGQELFLPETAAPGNAWDQSPAAPPRVKGARVLLADDDPKVRQVIGDVLRASGAVIEEAGDGEEALAAVARRRPDLVIIDRRMPKLDGLEVIRALRAAPATHNLPVLLLNLDEDATRDGFAAGADDYMTKPFTPAQIRSRVERWLLRSRSANGKKRHPTG